MTAAALVCPLDGEIVAWAGAEWRHEGCGSPLRLTDGPGLTPDDIDVTAPSLWRYASALRVPPDGAVHLGEGMTPLVPTIWRGSEVAVKCEHLSPTGSFKDRGAVTMIAHLRQLGVTEIVEDSSGNAGAAIATFAAAAGISCTILAPSAAPQAKIRQIARTGATVELIDGSRDDVSRAAEARAAAGAIWASHARQPTFNEGMRTLAFEIWEQLDFGVPDHVVTPVGNGATLLGLHYGFAELAARGSIQRAPRLHAGQAARVAPLRPDVVETGPTVADGIAVAAPARLVEMERALLATGGTASAVAESDIIDTWQRLNRRGLALEPTCAVAFATVEQLRDGGTIAPDESVVVIATGHGLKSELSPSYATTSVTPVSATPTRSSPAAST